MIVLDMTWNVVEIPVKSPQPKKTMSIQTVNHSPRTWWLRRLEVRRNRSDPTMFHIFLWCALRSLDIMLSFDLVNQLAPFFCWLGKRAFFFFLRNWNSPFGASEALAMGVVMSHDVRLAEGDVGDRTYRCLFPVCTDSYIHQLFFGFWRLVFIPVAVLPGSAVVVLVVIFWQLFLTVGLVQSENPLFL